MGGVGCKWDGWIKIHQTNMKNGKERKSGVGKDILLHMDGAERWRDGPKCPKNYQQTSECVDHKR